MTSKASPIVMSRLRFSGGPEWRSDAPRSVGGVEEGQPFRGNHYNPWITPRTVKVGRVESSALVQKIETRRTLAFRTQICAGVDSFASPHD